LPGRFFYKMRAKTFELNSNVELMGVVNITPDSFFDGGRFFEREKALDRIFELIEEGASFIDIGGESSRPQSLPVTVDEELKRILPVLKAIKGKLSIPISVDTYKSQVASVALEEGADIINDISALRFDPELPEIVAKHGAGVVLMHMQGTPRNMQDDPRYENVVEEIIDFLEDRIQFALSTGIPKESIMIDPGIGFGKRLRHNLEILKDLERFKSLNVPVLVGPSRKTFIGEITGKTPEERIFGTAGVVAYCAMKGANVIRIHDVSQMKDVVDLVQAINKVKI